MARGQGGIQVAGYLAGRIGPALGRPNFELRFANAAAARAPFIHAELAKESRADPVAFAAAKAKIEARTGDAYELGGVRVTKIINGYPYDLGVDVIGVNTDGAPMTFTHLGTCASLIVPAGSQMSSLSHPLVATYAQPHTFTTSYPEYAAEPTRGIVELGLSKNSRGGSFMTCAVDIKHPVLEVMRQMGRRVPQPSTIAFGRSSLTKVILPKARVDHYVNIVQQGLGTEVRRINPETVGLSITRPYATPVSSAPLGAGAGATPAAAPSKGAVWTDPSHVFIAGIGEMSAMPLQKQADIWSRAAATTIGVEFLFKPV